MDEPNQWGFLLMVLVVNIYIFGMIYWVWTRPNSALAKHFEKRSARRRVRRNTSQASVPEAPASRTVGQRPTQRTSGRRPDPDKK